MADTLKKLITPIQLANASAVIYTVPASTTTVLGAVVLMNDTTTAVTATIHLCHNGAAETVVNMIENAINVPSDGRGMRLDELDGVIMNTGDTIEAFASTADQVTIHLTGVEQT